MSKLIVNTIEAQTYKYDSDTTGMTFDSSGVASFPNKLTRNIPAFRAMGAASYVAFSAADTLTYNSTTGNGLYNLGGHYDTSTYTFTAPLDGLYYFKANALIQSEGPGGIQLRHGTLGVVARSYDHGRDFNVSGVFNLSAGDTIRATTESATSWYLGTYGAFNGYMIG
ncbi:MAG: hypothetical protein CMO44_00800 [Verrucomicrobiales bacterium]|nr:hypothetical protein [Verrucomicrobiales bacterium]|tara:strand:+ start:842 stop:1345 length:504 start_codon:yes stop_codon:yes gene_type:complete